MGEFTSTAERNGVQFQDIEPYSHIFDLATSNPIERTQRVWEGLDYCVVMRYWRYLLDFESEVGWSPIPSACYRHCQCKGDSIHSAPHSTRESVKSTPEFWHRPPRHAQTTTHPRPRPSSTATQREKGKASNLITKRHTQTPTPCPSCTFPKYE